MATSTVAISAAALTAMISSNSRREPHLVAISSTEKGRSFFSSMLKRPIFAYYSCCPSKSHPKVLQVFASQISPQLELESSNRKKLLLFRRILLCTLVSSSCCLACGAALAAAAAAAADSIRASGIGLKVATALRSSGWPDQAIVFALATLPIIELRGAIPVGYWMNLHPVHLTVLSILGNMVPVPIIVLYLKKFATFISQKNASATGFLEHLLERAREKAGPVEEFQWLGLMLFVAVPFPGTGAWTGAFVAAILDMPFWSAVSANFIGVVLAGLLVNLLVNLGMKYAVVVGLLLFVLSTVMWSVLRQLKKSLTSN